MQAVGANSPIDQAEAPVAAPLEAAWESIRTNLRRDLGARTFDGWLKPAELGRSSRTAARSTSSCRASSWPTGCARISAIV